MDSESKENKKMPEDPVDEPMGEEKIQDKAEEAVEDKQDKTEEDSKDVIEDESEKTEKIEENIDEKPINEETKKEPEPIAVKEKKGKKEEKKPQEKPKKDRGPDFKYIVRISNTDIDGEKNVLYGLTSIKGINVHMASLITDQVDINKYMKIGDLKDSQIEKLQEIIDNINEIVPSWMVNHRKDYETGEDIHLIGSEIDMRHRDEINIMKKIRSYRGIRHERGLPVRGQRTRANNRKGLALGVSKKREQK